MARAEIYGSCARPDRMSGVIGLGRRYKLLPGLTLSMNYERVQVLSGGPALAPDSGDRSSVVAWERRRVVGSST